MHQGLTTVHVDVTVAEVRLEVDGAVVLEQIEPPCSTRSVRGQRGCFVPGERVPDGTQWTCGRAEVQRWALVRETLDQRPALGPAGAHSDMGCAPCPTSRWQRRRRAAPVR